jgi:hypothetical protein
MCAAPESILDAPCRRRNGRSALSFELRHLHQQSIVFGRETAPSRGSRHVCAHYGDGFAVSTGWPQSAGAWYARLPETRIQPRRIRKSASRSGRRWPLSFRNLGRLDPMVLTCGNSLCLTLANAYPRRIRRSGAHRDVSMTPTCLGCRHVHKHVSERDLNSGSAVRAWIMSLMRAGWTDIAAVAVS